MLDNFEYIPAMLQGVAGDIKKATLLKMRFQGEAYFQEGSEGNKMNDNWFKKYGWLIPLCLLLLVTAFMVLMASNQAKMNRTLQEFIDSGTPYVTDRGNSRVVNLASSALSVTTAISFEDAPEDEAPADEAPVDEAPAEEPPAEEAPVDEAPVDDAPVDEAPEGEAPEGEAPEGEAPERSGSDYFDYVPETMTDEILLEIRDTLNLFLDILLLVIAARLVYLVFFNFRYLWRY